MMYYKNRLIKALVPQQVIEIMLRSPTDKCSLHITFKILLSENNVNPDQLASDEVLTHFYPCDESILIMRFHQWIDLISKFLQCKRPIKRPVCACIGAWALIRLYQIRFSKLYSPFS